MSFILRSRSFSQNVKTVPPLTISPEFQLKDASGQFKEISKHEFLFRPNEMDVLKVKGLPLLAEMGGVQGIAAALRTDMKTGLFADEVVDDDDFDLRSEIFGRNIFPKPPPKGFFRLCWEALNDPMLIVLIVCGIISVVMNTINDPDEGFIEGLAILLAVVLVTLVGAGNNYQKERQFRKLEKEDVRVIQVMRAGVQYEIEASAVQVGDLVILSVGDRIPADGIYVHGTDLSVDESSLTGEPKNIKKNIDNFLFYAGTNVLEGEGLMIVVAVGDHSEWGKISAAIMEERDDTPLEKKLEKMASQVGYLGMGAAALLFVGLLIFMLAEYVPEDKAMFGSDGSNRILQMFITAVTIVVVAVPEGLPLAVTISLAYSMMQMIVDKNFVRVLAACETMGNATTICSDKTGTLTQNLMTVENAWVGGKFFDHRPKKIDMHETQVRLFSEGEILNNKCVFKPDIVPGARIELLGDNQTAQALFRWSLDVLSIENEKGYAAMRDLYPVAHSYPFNSAHKMGAVLVPIPETKDYRMFIKGAYERILAKSSSYLDYEGKVVPLTDEVRNEINETVIAMAKRGLRCVCVAYREYDNIQAEADGSLANAPSLDEIEDLIAICVPGIRDPLRPEVAESVRQCQQAGVIVRMVTGDHLETAKFIARDCHILTNPDQIALEGGEFRIMSDEEKLAIAPRLRVMARSSPFDKQELVRLLKSQGHVVAVTGDGTNDAAALKEADVGLSMGIQGTDVAKNSSEIIILDDNFVSIVKSVMWGRSVYDNIRKFLQFQLTVNVVALTISLVGAFSGMETPLKAVQLLWVNLIMDTMAALALGTEAPTKKLLERNPFNRDAHLISRIMWRNILGQSFFQLVILAIVLFLGDKIWDVEAKSVHHYTILFNVFVFMTIFNEFNSKSVDNSVNVFSGLSKNWIFLAVIIFTVMLQIIMVEAFGSWASTTPLSPIEWVTSIAFSLIPFPAYQIIRFIPIDLSYGQISIDKSKVFYEDPNFFVHSENLNQPAKKEPDVSVEVEASHIEIEMSEMS